MNRRDMYAVVITDEGGVRRRLDFTKPELTVGRVQGNDIVLAKRNVSKQHARLTLKADQAVVVDLNSTNGTWVNGRKISSPHRLKQGDKIYIADFILTVEPANDGADRPSSGPSVSEPPPLPKKSPAPAKSSMPIHDATVSRRPEAARSRPASTEEIRATSLPPQIENRETDAPKSSRKAESPLPANDPLGALLSRLADRIDIDEVDPKAMQNQERWSATRAAIAETFLAMQTDGSVNADVDMRNVAHVALHEAVGLGALDDLLSKDSVRTILVNGPELVFVDEGTGLQACDARFSSSAALHRVARRLAAQAGQTLGSQAVLHGRLGFGPRLTILQSPLVAHGPVIEVHVTGSWSLESMSDAGWMSADAATYLSKAVAECRNIIVAGPRGSGVTEVMSALAKELPETESCVAIEAIPNMQIDRGRVVSLTAGDSGVSFGDAIGHGTRLRSEHLLINDLSGADTVTALTAVLGREPGHLLGVHCWSNENAVEGLLLAAASGGADRGTVAELVGSTIDLIVATQRGAEGPRVTAIVEVRGHEGGDISYQSVPF